MQKRYPLSCCKTQEIYYRNTKTITQPAENGVATSIIKSNRNIESGNITKYSSSINGTLDWLTCYKVGNVVSVGGRIFGMTNQAASGRFFLIPEGFRPRGTTRAMGYLLVEGGTGLVPILATIDTEGTVAFAYSASANCSQVGFSATYAI